MFGRQKAPQFPVHKRQIRSPLLPLKLVSWDHWLMLGLLTGFTVIVIITIGWYPLMFLWVFWAVLLLTFHVPKESGRLTLGKKIRFEDGTAGTLRFSFWYSSETGFTTQGFPRSCRYEEIALLYIGQCERRFRRLGTFSNAVSADAWEQLYGQYIIAENVDGKRLFVCHDSVELRTILTEKCRDTAVSVFDEERLAAHRRKLAKEQSAKQAAEERIYHENGGDAVMQAYEGYIN